MICRDWVTLAALALMAVSACGGKAAQSDSSSGSDSGAQSGSNSSGGVTTTPVACDWPASLDPSDGAIGQCIAARAYLSCEGSTGGGEDCLSNDPSQCPGPNPIIGVTFSGCKDQCAVDEYAVACGGPGPGPWPAPPVGCRDLLPGPGGGTVSCCPCAGPDSADSGGDTLVVTDDDGGSFACGNGATCDGRSQVCEHVEGGAPPGVDFYGCIPIPSACDRDVSCACVTTALRGRGADQCSATGSNVTVQIDAP
jgi:hypothetical protein